MKKRKVEKELRKENLSKIGKKEEIKNKNKELKNFWRIELLTFFFYNSKNVKKSAKEFSLVCKNNNFVK